MPCLALPHTQIHTLHPSANENDVLRLTTDLIGAARELWLAEGRRQSAVVAAALCMRENLWFYVGWCAPSCAFCPVLLARMCVDESMDGCVV